MPNRSVATSFSMSSQYEELNVIGTGAYGTVYKARDLHQGTIVALKKVRVALTEDGIPMSTLREIALLKQIDGYQHPNIVKLLDVVHGQRLDKENQLLLYLVFEHLNQDLACYLDNLNQRDLTENRIKEISCEILTGVDFLHSHRIIHRDLKPHNLLVTKEGRIKLADFGLAKSFDFEMKLTSVVVTLWYRAPEVLMCLPYNTSVDIWSTACIIAELYNLAPLFPGTSDGDQLDKIFQLIGRPSDSNWPAGVSVSCTNFPAHPSRQPKMLIPRLCEFGNDLLNSMLQFEPKKRLSASQCLRHAYFTDERIV
ncbi:cyclin-dependent kinase 4 [Ctenocephalides felis]|uniref:cyclin-dependent kinase 4 n=1 Tax=Ctenocephalides felis TaxID=7515 RepID=UPI000E6E19C9|nr:cyclin-dependent kinase 4 [Ctenocephalides felis]